MAEGVLAVVGTVLGGATGGGLAWANTFYSERRQDLRARASQERAEQHAREQARQAEGRATKNMASNIIEALSKVEEALSKFGVSPPTTEDGTPLGEDGAPVRWPLGWEGWYATWELNWELLADSWDQESYIVMSRAYSRINELQHGLSTTGGAEMSSADLEFFKNCQRQLSEARDVLQRRANVSP